MPKIINGFEVFDNNEAPEARAAHPRRGARRKYPWWEMAPGTAFRFAADVIEQSARVQASTMSKSTGYEFKTYNGVDSRLWCMRVDGLPRSSWPDIKKTERYVAEPTVAHEDAADSTHEISDEFENARHDSTGGVPTVFGSEKYDPVPPSQKKGSEFDEII